MSVDRSEAVDAFERLGLTSYEAKVFIALHRLGAGTARDVSRIADVPRSQVYSVAESLAERGLLEVQQSSPIRYRPVSIEEARATLRKRFEREQERAFRHVDRVRRESADEESQEDIWTIRGRDSVDDRVVDLLANAEDQVVYGTRLAELVADPIDRALEARADDGVAVRVVTRADAVRDHVEGLDGVAVEELAVGRGGDERSGRIVVVDDDGLLLSVVGDDGAETAIWSRGSLFATVLIQLIEASADPAA